MLLGLSVILNFVLIASLAVVFLRAKGRIVDEKTTTFAGCLGAISFSLAHPEPDDRFKRAALGLSGMRDGFDVEEIRPRLVRAAYMRLFRREPITADVGGETIRSLTAQWSNDTGIADEVWDYIGRGLDGEPGVQEPYDHFTTQQLAAAQMQTEGEIIRLYKAAVEKVPIRLFDGP